jgi:glycosyltransferase involved in cell wall biosynthesis
MRAARNRICVVTPHQSSAYGGGAELQIDYLISALLPLNRYQVYYLARNAVDAHSANGYRIVPIGRRNRTLKLGYSIDGVSLYRALLRIRPHLIYQRVACGYTGVCALYARRHGARLVWHVAHDSDLDRRGSLLSGNPLAASLERSSINYAIEHADKIVVQTRQQARLLECNHGRTADAVIPNFHPEPREKIDKSGPTTVLWVANLKQWKQPEVFARIAAASRDLTGVRFLMVGARATGPRDRQWTAGLMRTVDATPNLEYAGRRTHAEVNELLARAHLLVNTSAQEGFPNTFIQAWMREVPVVSLVNPDDVLDREKVGIHARTEDALIDAVRVLATDSRRRLEYAERARRYSMERHSLRNAELLEKLFDDRPAAGSIDASAVLANSPHYVAREQ